MQRQHSERILKAIEVATVLSSIYSWNPPLAIAITPLAIHCLINIYREEDRKNHDQDRSNKQG